MKKRRAYKQPNLHFQVKGEASEYMVYVLDEGEVLDMGTSSKPFHHVCTGPSVVLRTVRNGLDTREEYVGSQWVWGWIQRLMIDPEIELVEPDECYAVTDYGIRMAGDEKFDREGRWAELESVRRVGKK